MVNRDLLIVVFGRVATAVITLVGIKAATSYLSPEQYGHLSLIIMIQMLCGLFLINPLGQYINRHTHAWWEEGSFWRRLRSYRYYILFTAAVGAVLMIVIDESPSAGIAYWTGGALFVMVVFSTWNATLIPVLNMLGLRSLAVLFGIMTVSLSLLSSILLMQWFTTAIAWFFGQSIGMAVGALGAGIMLRKMAKVKVTASSKYSLISKKDFLDYCLPLAVGTGFMWVQLSGYRFVIESYWGLAQLGFISVGLLLSGQVWAMAESLVMQFLYPYFFKKISRNDAIEGKEALSDLLNVLGPQYLILAGITAAVAPLLVYLLVDEKYSGVVTFVVIGALVESCRALANVFGNAVQVTRKTYSLAIPYVVGSFVVVASLFYGGIEHLSVRYIGYSLVVGAISMLLVMGLVMFRQVRFSLDIKRWIFGGFVMVVFYMSDFGVTGNGDWVASLISLGGVGVVWISLSAVLLWKNPALERLLLVKLRTE